MKAHNIKEFVSKQGADVCGIAGIDRFISAPDGFHPRAVYNNTRSVIVFGTQFPVGTFQSKSLAPYTMVRNQLIQFNDTLALSLCNALEKEGYTGIPIPSSEPYEFWDPLKRQGRGIISLKHAAVLAGLGNLGKNTLLIHEKFGNRLWLGGVVTNLDLDPDPLADSLCPENCTLCIDTCPQSALDAITIDQSRCREICYSYTEGGGWIIACNLCRAECPFSSF
jgi:epoxyqueuosine reductase